MSDALNQGSPPVVVVSKNMPQFGLSTVSYWIERLNDRNMNGNSFDLKEYRVWKTHDVGTEWTDITSDLDTVTMNSSSSGVAFTVRFLSKLGVLETGVFNPNIDHGGKPLNLGGGQPATAPMGRDVVTPVRRFENTSGNHNKYWEVWIEKETSGEYTLFTHWGRIGSTGQGQSQPFKLHRDAESAAFKKMDEKERKGYEEVAVPGADAPDPHIQVQPVHPTAVAPPPPARCRGCDRAIGHRPDCVYHPNIEADLIKLILQNFEQDGFVRNKVPGDGPEFVYEWLDPDCETICTTPEPRIPGAVWESWNKFNAEGGGVTLAPIMPNDADCNGTPFIVMNANGENIWLCDGTDCPKHGWDNEAAGII